jgi:hypothetical protein
MTKKRRSAPAPKPIQQDKPATLEELLSPGILSKLKAQAAELRAEEGRSKDEKKRQAEELHKAEQKRLDNDFEHLLNTSMPLRGR